jgi:hypothetical protein
MTSVRQIEANRRNACKSTGPITEEGKQRSRCNAVRHGLTAETVIGALEDAEDYAAFQAAIIADYDAQSAVERELVLRLASLLWRQPPVRTASMSLAWRIAPEQVGIGFDDLDEFGEIIDAVVREGRYCLFTGTEDGEAAVFPDPSRY